MNKKLTTEEFIERAREVYGDIYDYSLVEYINNQTKVIIVDANKFKHLVIPTTFLKNKINLDFNTVIDKTEFFKFKSNGVHNDKYDYSLVDYIDSKTKIKIICKTCGEITELTPSKHLQGQGCKICSVKNRGLVQRKTTEEFIKKAKDIHGDKYDYSETLYINTHEKVNIFCKKCLNNFTQQPANHLQGKGCPKCVGYQMEIDEIKVKCIEKLGNVFNWDSFKYFGSSKHLLINDLDGFEHKTYLHSLLNGNKLGIRSVIDKEGFLKFKFNQIHGDRYDYSEIKYNGIEDKIKINCSFHGFYEQTIHSHLSGNGCPICNLGFTRQYKLQLLDNIQQSDLSNMDPIELSIIIGQGLIPIDFKRLLDTDANSPERLSTLNEIKEQLLSDNDEIDTSNTSLTTLDQVIEPIDDVDGEITDNQNNNTNNERNSNTLPGVSEISDLKLLDNSLYSTMDAEAIEALIQYKLHKLWNSVLNNNVSFEALKSEEGGEYFNRIKTQFLDEYNEVIKVEPKVGYCFKYQPSLMQKLTVYRLLKNKSYGNWSGTGAGKTLSFIMSSRELDSRLTLVIALNSTVTQTGEAIQSVYPDSIIHTDYNNGDVFDRNKYNYLILNYEKFQQEYSEEKFQSLTNNNQIDFVVIDEVHNTKQRQGSEESIRREVLNRLLGRARENNADLHTLAMSATPVINDLFEAKSLLTMMTGLEYNDIDTRKTLNNALKIFQQLLLNGIRFMPKYDIELSELTGENMTNLDIDGSHLLDDLLKLSQRNVVDIEKLLLDDKLKVIDGYLKPGVIVYSHFTTGVFDKVIPYIKSKGFRVEPYSGDESIEYREGIIKKFKKGEIDILVCSDPITTGVDGLQEICNRMILLTLPWTDSLYTQLKGRIYRQGSLFGNVEFIIPQVKIRIEDGQIWSWDVQRLNLIKNKRTLADAAVDGLIPSRVLPTKETMFKKSIESLEKWKERINLGQIVDKDRDSIVIVLYPEIDNVEEMGRRMDSELSEFNRRGKTTHSNTMHKEFTENPDAWHRYHRLRNERMEQWGEIPYEYIATKIKDKQDVIVDFGCGENKFKDCVQNKVISFDHIAIDDSVIACDIKDVSNHLGDESVDIAMFSLALWGTNHKDYIKEAYRVLKRKGMIYIAEPIKSYETSEDEQKLVDLINEAGFQIVGGLERRNKFIYITGIKIN